MDEGSYTTAMREPRRRPLARSVLSRGRWMARATPTDYVIALSGASGSIPVVGRQLEALGGFAALGVGGRRYVSSIVTGIARSRLTSGSADRRATDRASTSSVLSQGLHGIVADELLAQPWPTHRAPAPALTANGQRRYVHRASVRYGDHPSQLLDVWRGSTPPTGPAPVLIYVPGGAWVFGRRQLQGHALMAHLVRRGWVCLSIQYRTSPRHRWPRQIEDVKAAIAWARANVDRFGGDRDFVVLAGSSAGGHLATLAGLTANEPQWQSGLVAEADTSVDAVVSLYGLYDWHDRSTPERDRFIEFLERVVVKRAQSRHPDVFRDASPTERVHASAPPMLAVHGSEDRLIPVGEARAFVARLRAVSGQAVGYLELPGAGHGFDLIDGARTAAVVTAIGRFLQQLRDDRARGDVTSAV